MTATMSTTIPFSGFYESMHEEVIRMELEMEFSDPKGDVMSDLLHRVYSENMVDLSALRRRYAQAYVKHFTEHVSEVLPSLQFEELVRPRAHNYERDRVFATVEKADVERMFEATPTDILAATVAKKFKGGEG